MAVQAEERALQAVAAAGAPDPARHHGPHHPERCDLSGPDPGGPPRARSALRSESSSSGAFAWARRALASRKRRLPARAVYCNMADDYTLRDAKDFVHYLQQNTPQLHYGSLAPAFVTSKVPRPWGLLLPRLVACPLLARRATLRMIR